MASPSKLSLGVDYGTNSCRAVIVSLADGAELASRVFEYPSGEAGILLDPSDPDLARQRPQDWTDGFVEAVSGAVEDLKAAGHDPAGVVAVGIDTTGSTPLPVDADGVPLACQERFSDNLAAQAWLWKDHTGHAEAAEITALARERGEPYLAACGGTYSSEWFWSKILRCLRAAPDVFAAAHSWVECCDYLTAWACGDTTPETLRRSVCAAGHKAMFSDRWGGLPSEDFLAVLDSELAPLRGRLFSEAFPPDEKAGTLRDDLAEECGLPSGIPVAVGAFDAHMGAVGAGVKPGVLVKIMGTSTCDITVGSLEPDGSVPEIEGLCGVVNGSVIGGMTGLEAGQSAVGDLFAWAVAQLTPGRYGTGGDAHAALNAEAENLSPGQSGLVALDWNNGNRTVLVNPRLSGLLLGQTLHTTAAEVYRACVEATAFGAKVIVDRFESGGVNVDEVVVCGGIAEKSPMTMQVYADVLDRPIKTAASAQTCGLGAALSAAVAAGAFESVEEAQAKMAHVKERVFRPEPRSVAAYAELFAIYKKLHDAFGGVERAADLSTVMPDLRRIAEASRKGGALAGAEESADRG